METKPYGSNFVLMELCFGRCLYSCFHRRSFAFIVMSIGGFTSIITFIVTHLVSGPPCTKLWKCTMKVGVFSKTPNGCSPSLPFIYENRLWTYFIVEKKTKKWGSTPPPSLKTMNPNVHSYQTLSLELSPNDHTMADCNRVTIRVFSGNYQAQSDNCRLVAG